MNICGREGEKEAKMASPNPMFHWTSRKVLAKKSFHSRHWMAAKASSAGMRAQLSVIKHPSSQEGLNQNDNQERTCGFCHSPHLPACCLARLKGQAVPPTVYCLCRAVKMPVNALLCKNPSDFTLVIPRGAFCFPLPNPGSAKRETWPSDLGL